MSKINNVQILAGTHGNELSGIYINKLIQDNLYNIQRSSFSSSSQLVNAKAIECATRYIDTDLNREFSSVENNESPNSYERLLSQKFMAENTLQYIQKGNQLLIDLHNTTSNMGATLILLSNDPFYTKMGAYVNQQMPEANILFEDEKSWGEQAYLCTATKYGVMIEVGAQAHGSLQHSTLILMQKMLTAVLDYIEQSNLNTLDSLKDYEPFYFTKEVAIPLDQDGLRNAMVHPAICGKDFQVVKQGEPLLITLQGEEIGQVDTPETYPHFINESAYCKKHIAMALPDKRLVII
ncbi:aspartoacylase [Psychromonas arctica]|uniref:aspartoacylase n=1 Tax=Psychromonas arctica TaxID=168275 RepID=UPI002FD6CE5A